MGKILDIAARLVRFAMVIFLSPVILILAVTLINVACIVMVAHLAVDQLRPSALRRFAVCTENGRIRVQAKART